MRALLAAARRRVFREPLGTVRHVLARVRDDPVWVVLRLKEKLGIDRPSIWRTLARLSARKTRGWPGTLGILAAWANGNSRELESRLGAVGREGSDRDRARAARFLTHTERPEQALELVRGRADPRCRGAAGLALSRLGCWDDAIRELEEAVAAPGGTGLVPELVKTRETRQALDPGWRPTPLRHTHFEPRPDRVLHMLNNSLPYLQTGYTVRSHRIMVSQREVGLDPVVVTRPGFPWDSGHLTAPPVEAIEGVSYHHLRADHLAGAGTARKIEEGAAALLPLVERLRPAALHPTSPHINAQTAFALREATGLPVVYELRGFLEDTWLSRREIDAESSEHYRLTRAVEAHCASQADHVVTLGEAMRADLIERGVPRERITVVPNAVDVDTFAPTGLGPAVRHRLGMDDGVVLGYVTSLVPYEGVETLLKAVAELRQRGHGLVRGLIVGEGVARPHLEEEAARLGLDEAVLFTGRVPHDEIRGYYEAIDVFVVPRRNTRVCRMVSPLKPVEAMALERCLVVSALPALEELVVEGKSGLTFRAEDPQALADVVEPLLDDPQRRREFGRAAREQVGQLRTWRHNAARYREVYAAVAALRS